MFHKLCHSFAKPSAIKHCTNLSRWKTVLNEASITFGLNHQNTTYRRISGVLVAVSPKTRIKRSKRTETWQYDRTYFLLKILQNLSYIRRFCCIATVKTLETASIQQFLCDEIGLYLTDQYLMSSEHSNKALVQDGGFTLNKYRWFNRGLRKRWRTRSVPSDFYVVFTMILCALKLLEVLITSLPELIWVSNKKIGS